MAMLIIPEIFKNTWNENIYSELNDNYGQSFWINAIRKVNNQYPGFIFIAEVYWDKEWELQQQGFDYTYDKRLYDRLKNHEISLVKG